jgi:hypothetical protein
LGGECFVGTCVSEKGSSGSGKRRKSKEKDEIVTLKFTLVTRLQTRDAVKWLLV